MVLTACFPQDRIAFLAGLALWGAACALVAAVLRNFLALAAQLAGVTAAIIAANQLGATGGVNAIAAFFCFLLAPTNQTSYDTQQFYNAAAAAVAGLGSAALSFRLLPLLPPASSGLSRRRLSNTPRISTP